MAIKFQCPRCGKRYVDWGAEKLGFKCPDCKDQDLLRIGLSGDDAEARPKLKRKALRPEKGARPAAPKNLDEDEPIMDEMAADEEEMDEEEEPEVVVGEGDKALGGEIDEVSEAVDEDEEEADDETPVGLDFEDSGGPVDDVVLEDFDEEP